MQVLAGITTNNKFVGDEHGGPPLLKKTEKPLL